MLSIARLLL